MNTVSQTTILHHPLFHPSLIKAAGRAHTCLPEDNGRIARAVEIVLAGGVEAVGAGRWTVASQSTHPECWYDVASNSCTCRDFELHATHTHHYACKHVIATWLYRRAVQALEKEEPVSTSTNPDELVVQTVEEYFVQPCWVAMDDAGTPCNALGPCPGHTCTCRAFAEDGTCTHATGLLPPYTPQAPQDAAQENTPAVGLPQAAESTVGSVSGQNAPLPEAAASANAFVLVNGHRVQVTLRDFDETRLMERMIALLADYAPAPGK